jgi:hypothetical protein
MSGKGTVLPAENVVYTKINDGQFYRSRTINEMIDVEDVAGQFVAACELALRHARLLREAGDSGVAKAAALADVAESVATFSDEPTTKAFLVAFRAARDAP